MAVEVLKPDALYTDFSVARMTPRAQPAQQTPPKDEGRETRKRDQTGEKNGEWRILQGGDEIGGELLERQAWESSEAALRTWEKSNLPSTKSPEEPMRRRMPAAARAL